MPYTPDPTNTNEPPDVVGTSGAYAATAAAEFRAIKLYLRDVLLAGISTVSTALSSLTTVVATKQPKLHELNTINSTAYTLVPEDNAKTLVITNASPITLTLENSLPIGFHCTVIQGGVGQITNTPEAGATLNSVGGKTKHIGQWAVTNLQVIANASGTQAVFVLSGDISL